MTLLSTLLSQKQEHINDFVRRANARLPDNNPLYFDGYFISGQTNQPDILFIGINPGHRDWDNIEGRQADLRLHAYQDIPCKYIAAAAEGNRFAKRVIKVVCDGDSRRLSHCAETSLLSYFASPNERVVNAQIKQLPLAMQTEHSQLTHLPIHEIKPKHIVCIGWRTFDAFIQRYGRSNVGATHRQAIKKLPICMQGEDKMMDYYAKTECDGITVHGVRHFSTPLSHAMLADMTVIFKAVWADIERSKVPDKP